MFDMDRFCVPMSRSAPPVVQLLKDEMEMNMRLIGAASVADLNPSMLDTRGLQAGHQAGVPSDTLGLNVYDPLVSPRFAEKSKL